MVTVSEAFQIALDNESWILLTLSRDIHLAKYGYDTNTLTGVVSEVFEDHIMFHEWDNHRSYRKGNEPHHSMFISLHHIVAWEITPKFKDFEDLV